MKLRTGLILALSLGLGTTACASSGGGAGAAAAGPTAGPTAAPTPGAKVLAQGERPRHTGNTRAAEKALKQAREAAGDAEAQPFYQQALDAANAAIAEDARNPLAYRLAGEAHLGLKQYKEAGEAFDKAVDLRPIYQIELEPIREKTWINLYQEAAPAVNAGDYDKAITLFEDANAIYDERPEVMITLGQVYAQKREHDKALANLRKALEIINSDKIEDMDSATVELWHQQAKEIPVTIAQVLADAGRFEEAAAQFEKLAESDPQNIMFLRNLAALLIRMEKQDSAFAVYDRMLAHPDLGARDYYAIGVGFYQASAFKRAADAFKGAATKSVKDRDALEMWARSLQLDSLYDAVPPVAKRWIELDPNNRNAHLILAQAVNQLGDEEAARQQVQAIQALKVTVDNLQMRRRASGGAEVIGDVTNQTLEPGATVTLGFTFYDDAGNAIGTQAQQVRVAAKGTPVSFTVEFNSSDPVGGYGYTVMIS